MTPKKQYLLLRWCTAAVWLANGLFCKVLHLVPWHEQIVARILGGTYAASLTLTIGLLETGMAVWILTGVRSQLNTWLQIAIVAVMNLLEYILVPDLLLWGRGNAFFALLFIGVLYYNEFYGKPEKPKPALT